MPEGEPRELTLSLGLQRSEDLPDVAKLEIGA